MYQFIEFFVINILHIEHQGTNLYCITGKVPSWSTNYKAHSVILPYLLPLPQMLEIRGRGGWQRSQLWRFFASSWRPLFCKNRQQNLGDFWIFVKMGEFGRNLLNFLAKWTIFDHFWQKCYCKKCWFWPFWGGGDFWRKISPLWRILINRSWEHWRLALKV